MRIKNRREVCFIEITLTNLRMEVPKMFEVSDIVAYGVNGVCTVTEITTKRIDKVNVEYYVLSPNATKTAKVFVPVQNEKLVGKMRAVLTKDEIIDLLDNMPKEEEWISNKNIRFETFKNIISEGKSSELLRLIRTLKLHEKQQLKRGKRLHMADERFLKEAEKMVLGEFAYVLNESTDDILNRIENCA